VENNNDAAVYSIKNAADNAKWIPAKVNNQELKPCPLKAYQISLDEVVVIVFAETRSKAQYSCLKSANEAGFEYKFLDISSRMHCRRRPIFDVLKLSKNTCYGLEHMTTVYDEYQRNKGEN